MNLYLLQIVDPSAGWVVFQSSMSVYKGKTARVVFNPTEFFKKLFIYLSIYLSIYLPTYLPTHPGS